MFLFPFFPIDSRFFIWIYVWISLFMNSLKSILHIYLVNSSFFNYFWRIFYWLIILGEGNKGFCYYLSSFYEELLIPIWLCFKLKEVDIYNICKKLLYAEWRQFSIILSATIREKVYLSLLSFVIVLFLAFNRMIIAAYSINSMGMIFSSLEFIYIKYSFFLFNFDPFTRTFDFGSRCILINPYDKSSLFNIPDIFRSIIVWILIFIKKLIFPPLYIFNLP